MMTYNEFYNSLSADDIKEWLYNGVRLCDLYKEYIELSTPPIVQMYPMWALDAMGGG